MAWAIGSRSLPGSRVGRPLVRTLVGLVAWLLTAGTMAVQASAAELVMFEDAGCVWCRKFDREIGPIYPKTEEGRRAPLRHLDIARSGEAGVRLARPVNATPTFVLADNGLEIGRITGYPGEDFFWGLLGELLAKLPPPAAGLPRLRDARLQVSPGLLGGTVQISQLDGACVDPWNAPIK
jgi:hypothetical protein